MTKHFILTLMIVTAFGIGTHSADAGPILVTTNGTLTDATAVTEALNSISMVGVLQVTATFADALTETLTWGAVTDPCGGSCPNFRGVESSSGWSLGGSGGTSAMQWMFDGRSSALSSLSFSGTNLAFDRGPAIPGGGEGTLGSSSGFDFSPVESSMVDFSLANGWTATYSNAVTLNGAAPVGDVYAKLVVTFGSTGYLGNFNFLQDTDFYTPAPTGGDPVDPPGGGGTAVPEPSSMALLGIGLASVGLGRRYRRA